MKYGGKGAGDISIGVSVSPIAQSVTRQMGTLVFRLGGQHIHRLAVAEMDATVTRNPAPRARSTNAEHIHGPTHARAFSPECHEQDHV